MISLSAFPSSLPLIHLSLIFLLVNRKHRKLEFRRPLSLQWAIPRRRSLPPSPPPRVRHLCISRLIRRQSMGVAIAGHNALLLLVRRSNTVLTSRFRQATVLCRCPHLHSGNLMVLADHVEACGSGFWLSVSCSRLGALWLDRSRHCIMVFYSSIW